jgi:cyclic beta-1,2-glucan synthetase
VLVGEKPTRHKTQSQLQDYRLILAFFPAADAAVERAVNRLAGAKVRCAASNERADRYPRLTSWFPVALENERVLVAETATDAVQPAVEEIRAEHPASVFVIPEVFTAPAEIPPAQDGSDLSWARDAARAKMGPEPALVPFIKRRVSALEREFDKAIADLAASVAMGHAPGPAANWLLENSYLVQNDAEEALYVLEGLKSKPDPGANYAQVHALAVELLRHSEHEVTEEAMHDALCEFQKVRALTTAELWNFTQLLRLALLGELTRLAMDAASAQQHREAAYLWADRLIASARHGEEAQQSMLGRMDGQPYAINATFLAALSELLQGEDDALPAFQLEVEKAGRPLAEIAREEARREALSASAAARAFGSLRALARLDVRKVFERVSVVDQELRRDPSGIYAASDFETRDRCRHEVDRIARWSGVNERDVARMAVVLAEEQTDPTCRLVPYFLVADGIAELERRAGAHLPLRLRFVRVTRRHSVFLYLLFVLALTLSFDALALELANGAGVHGPALLAILGALAIIPLSELAIQIVHAFIVAAYPPSKLPRMDYERGIPAECATLVVVPMMLVSESSIYREIEKLEVRYLANRDANLSFALFSDFLDAPERDQPGDAALVEIVSNGIAQLNRHYPEGNFLLFHRPREWSKSEGCWIGRERKRGKIEDLNAFLTGAGSSAILRVGRLKQTIRYVITLDSDTALPPNAGRRMVETISHPCNQVRIDPVARVRDRGYAIIQPRVAIALPGATATRFTRVFADTSGLDPYLRSVSDIQQDYFNEGTFHGKAIYDVAAFHTILGDRFPAESLLSHDLIEGAHAGVGLATDIELLENIPLDYASFSRRQHRWIRGDWQIFPWIFASVPSPHGSIPNPLGAVSRWRIFDNLRRSLVPVSALLLLLFGWLTSVAPAVWSVVVALAILIPALAPLIEGWVRQLEGTVHGRQGASDELIRSAVLTAFLPHQAWLAVDAIVRSTWRRCISHRRLLEWQTADAAERESSRHMDSTRKQMIVIAALSVLLMIVLYYWDRLIPTGGFLFLWMFAPFLLTWLNRTAARRGVNEIGDGDRDYLYQAARLTWRFFDDLVSSESHWLPPDNTQLALRVEVARRTSPTNIGFWFLSALSAHDFGWIPAAEFCRRCSETVATLDLMERQDGHFYNWYDIDTLAPLHPRYISSADSGNFLGCLWTVDRAIDELLNRPVLPASCLTGLQTTLSILSEVAGEDLYLGAPCRAAARLLRSDLRQYELIPRLRLIAHSADPFRDVSRWEAASGGDRAYWASRFVAEIDSWIEVIDRSLRWMETLSRPSEDFLAHFGKDVVELRRRVLRSIPSLAELERGLPAVNVLLNRPLSPEMPPEANGWLAQLKTEVQEAGRNAATVAAEMRRLQLSVRRFADETNLRTLYDRRRRHLAVGYVAEGPPVFTSHYDLLVSEARLASLIAIAKGDVPLEHWFALGRPMRTEPQGRQLLSWSGTMFEFLMPMLFTNSYENSQLDFACRNAVKAQIEFGENAAVPWGLSESAYSALDARQIYQYRAFGIPTTAQNPDVDNRLVISPYSTLMALLFNPRASVANLRRLDTDCGLRGPMGFYEAIDNSRSSTPEGRGGIAIYAYFAHHQGMSMAALANLLLGEIVRRRFHSDPRVRAIESLLFERIPLARLRVRERRAPTLIPVKKTTPEQPERFLPVRTTAPQTVLLGNGRYSVMLTNSGSGFSRWNQFDITRWRADSAVDQWGTFILIHEARPGATWAATLQPTCDDRREMSATFTANRAEFRRFFLGIESTLSVVVGADEDVEVRKLTLINRTRRRRFLEITSFAELAMAPAAADASHAAFNKIFVETEVDDSVIVAHRRLRDPDDPPLWVAHMLVGATGNVEFETDRSTFLGRGRTAANAEAYDRSLNGIVGATLDPAISLRCRESVEPRGKIELMFLTMAASSREELMRLVARYRRAETAVRVLDLAWTHEQLEFRYLQIGPAAAHSYQQLAGYLFFPGSPLRSQGSRPVPESVSQRDLWALGISGDLPIITITVREQTGLALMREALAAHSYWRAHGFMADLVILNQEATSYERPLNFQIQRMLDAHARAVGTDRPGGVFLRDWNALSDAQRALMLSASRVVLAGSRGTLARQLPPVREIPPIAAPFAPAGNVTEEPSLPLPFLELAYFNGVGGFSHDGREYAIYLGPGATTPTPWVNVIAGPDFGFMVSESGLGCTWNANSQQNRLTTWQNDPVIDPASEVIYLRDDDSGALWTPTALPIRENDAYRARHGQGYTVFEHNSHAIGQELTVFMPFEKDGPRDPVKICRLRLRNDSSRPRRLTVTWFCEWVLGSLREQQVPHIVTSFDETSGAVLARQRWSPDGVEGLAFAASAPPAESYSGDRRAFLGRNGSRANPAALRSTRLNNFCGPDLDPAAVLQLSVAIPVGGETEVVFLLGQAPRIEDVRRIVDTYRVREAVDRGLANARGWWDGKLETVQVHTPNLSVDLLVNRWLLYQSLSCRFWGRTALYQSSGAFGFRDQLQDAMALLDIAPELARDHILLSASRQFREGDVQHWWHPRTGNGVRTRCSDDLLWLPYAVAHYVSVTGDRSLLDEFAGFIEGPPLAPDQMEHLFVPAVAAESAPIWEHCRRALDAAWKIGPNGLPLIGHCDWNDGMNHVGNQGRGESVWLAWFLIYVQRRFAELADTRDAALAALCRGRITQLVQAIENACWDGEWYLRAFFDDGSPLGSHENEEARIDSLPQSWSVIAGGGNPSRALTAMNSANRELVKDADGEVLLFTPPFDHSSPHPGYIMGYPPGIRENGGQYTHGSLWLAMAWARLNNGEQAVRLLQLMNPAEHCRNPQDVQHYRGEPYVSAADVYASALQTGRSGWTWYTGSAAWMYRVWLEEVLGFQRRGDKLVLHPTVPSSWEEFRIEYRYLSTPYTITVRRTAGEQRVEMNGKVIAGGVIPLVDDKAPRSVTVYAVAAEPPTPLNGASLDNPDQNRDDRQHEQNVNQSADRI